MDTDIYRATRLAYRLGRQDQQRILEVRLRKDIGSEEQAKQLSDLAEGMTDELVDFSAIIRADIDRMMLGRVVKMIDVSCLDDYTVEEVIDAVNGTLSSRLMSAREVDRIERLLAAVEFCHDDEGQNVRFPCV